MDFNQVIGLEEVKSRLKAMVSENRIAHAIMLCDPFGAGAMPLALAFARLLLEKDESDKAMLDKWAHPDLHFSFPIYKKKTTDHPISDDYMQEWRDQLLRSTYFDTEDWLEDIKAENQQIVIYVSESDSLQQKLQLKASRGGRRVVIIWLPERMKTEAANKLLKIIEEPPHETYFLLITQDAGNVLGTIQSRTQQLQIPALSEAEIAEALKDREGVPEETAAAIAHVSQGSYTSAIKRLATGNEQQLFFDLFIQLMRLSYMRKIKDMRAWSETVSNLGRERQKRLLEYCQRLLRENFMYNFRRSEMVYQMPDEAQFSTKFARFINEKNVIPIMVELEHCQNDIEHNVNPRMVFFDFSLKMIVLLLQ